ncbi:MAG: geranylgeranylglyceryl/heptaprenylglyceryl phosphate synthase, partial [Bacteroidota bacterium]
IHTFKAESDIPVILFPGNPSQISPFADALLYLSLVSGRNAELLIGQHVVSAPLVKSSGLEVISTGYMLIDGGVPTTVSYMSDSTPIPANKPDIALCTAWAAEMQGKNLIYMDAGSGARNPISEEMIHKISSNIDIPLFIGGGIHTPEKVYANCKAGANIIVVGNAIERDPMLIKDLAQATKESTSSIR